MEALLDSTSTLGKTASPLLDTDAPPRRTESWVTKKRPRRFLKLGSAMAFLAAGFYALIAQNAYVASDQAVVSADAVMLRAPISGYLAESGLAVGASVTRGEVVGHLHDPDADTQRLQDLRQRLALAIAERDAVTAEEATLQDLRDALRQRVRLHDGVAAQVLAGRIDASARELHARLALRDQQRREAERRSTLEQAGVAAHADADRGRTASIGADDEAEAGRADLANLEAQHRAALDGIMVDASGNDVTYSAQRADELTIRLAELERTRVRAAAEVPALEASIAAEARRTERLAESPLMAPVTGIVWRIGAANGERVGLGEDVAQIVDCRSAFLVVPLPQDRLSAVAIGTEIRFRLAGEDRDRAGRVTAVSGEGVAALGPALAAVPAAPAIAAGTVRIALTPDSEPAGCLVGRTAHVLIPSGGSDWLHRLGRLFY